MNKAVFIDRDGTIAKDVPYCSRPEDFELLPGAAAGIKLLKANGFKVIVITNQSGIARGYFSEETLARIHQKMREELAQYDACVDAIYYCPHHPDDDCDCRKPKPKLVLQAARDLDIDLRRSYVIGDSEMDVQLAKQAGCAAAVQVTQEAGSRSVPATASFIEAVALVLEMDGGIKPETPPFSPTAGVG